MLDAVPGMSGLPWTAMGAPGLPLTATGAPGFSLTVPGISGLPMAPAGVSGLPQTVPGASALPSTMPGVNGNALEASDESLLPKLREEESMARSARQRQTADLLFPQRTAVPGTEKGGELPYAVPDAAEGGASVGTEDALERIDSFFRRDSRRYDSGFDILT